MQRRALWLLFAFGLVAGAAWWAWPTDRDRVLEAAEALARAATESDAALAAELERRATADVTVNVADLPDSLRGREAITAAAALLRGVQADVELRLEQVDVHVEGARAELSAIVVTEGRLGILQRRNQRHVTSRFVKQRGEFRLSYAEVSAENRDQPEARP